MNEELKTFISKMRAAGKADSEIAAELKTAGWTEADITPAFISMVPSPVGQNPSQSIPQTQIAVKPVSNKRLIWVILFSIIILLVGGYLLLRILPLVLANALRRQGTTIKERVEAPTLAPNLEQGYISFPNKIITFQTPPTWYQKKELQSEESYAMHFASVKSIETDESRPPLTMEITVTYASKETPSLAESVDMARKGFLETQRPGTIAVFTILKEQSTLVDGMPTHQFDYKVDINKQTTKREKNPDGSWAESTNFISRVDRGRQLIFLDSRKNLFVVTFVALEAEWNQYEPDFRRVVESMKIKYK